MQQYYRFSMTQALLRDLFLPLSSDAHKGSQPPGPLSSVMESIALRAPTRSHQIETDWARIAHLEVTHSQTERWVPEPPCQCYARTQNIEECLQIRYQFISLIEKHAGPQIAQYCQNYYHQQGFDSLGRTFLQFFLHFHVNHSHQEKTIDLKELLKGFACGNYFDCSEPGVLHYHIYNAYNRCVILDKETATTDEQIIDFYLQLSGEIRYDAGKNVVTHQIRAVDLITDNQEHRAFLGQIFHIRPAPHMISLFLSWLFGISDDNAALFDDRGHYHPGPYLRDFQQRLCCGQLTEMIQKCSQVEDPSFDDLRDFHLYTFSAAEGSALENKSGPEHTPSRAPAGLR